MCSRNACPGAGLLVYRSIRSGFTRVASMYRCRAFTCCAFRIDPWAPMLIIFHWRPMGINASQRGISPHRTSTSIVEAENNSHPRETGFSNWSEDFQIPNLVFLNHDAIAFITLGNGLWNPTSTDV